MRSLYVIQGATGEYSDRSEWNVAIVETEEQAKQYVTAVTNQFQRIPHALMEERWNNEERMREHMTLDPNFSTDYTGTTYWYAVVDLLTANDLRAKLKAAAQ